MNGTLQRLFHLAWLASLSTAALAQSSSTGQCTEEFVQDYVLDDSATYARIAP